MPPVQCCVRRHSIRQAVQHLNEVLIGLEVVETVLDAPGVLAHALRDVALRYGDQPAVLADAMRQQLRRIDQSIEMAAGFLAEGDGAAA